MKRVRRRKQASAPSEFRRAAWLLVAVLPTACVPYTAKTVELIPRLSAGDYDGALQALENNRRSRDELLYSLQKGLVLHQAGRWEESNDSFEAAERLASELYTKSISQAVGSFIANDTTISYRPEPFEMALIPYYRSLNYIYLGQSDEAAVEARKASEYLERYVDFTGQAFEGEESWRQTRDRLSNNAFLQYYSGLLYEWTGETNDAFIAYRNAAAAYEHAGNVLDLNAPPSLGDDLRRAGLSLGFADELAQLDAEHPGLFGVTGPSEAGDGAARHGVDAPEGEVVVLLEVGSVPQKVQWELDFPILESDDYDNYDAWAADVSGRVAAGWHAGDVKIDYWVRVALPQLVSSGAEARSARITAGATGRVVEAVVAEDLERRAFVTFEAKRPGIVMKAIARSLIKYAAKKRAEQESEAAGYLVNLFGAVVEQADTRSWTTLPSSIAIARMRLPPGTHDLRVELLSAEGLPLTSEPLRGVVVRPDDWTFVAFRIY